MNERPTYTLAPPGTGLPALERFVGNILLNLRRWTGTRESFHSKIERERLLIRLLLERVQSDSGGRRILIPRILGLEDSSRNWSVWMVLDHLRIVHCEITSVLTDLVDGRCPATVTSIAAVKPSPECGPEVSALYNASCEQLQNAALSANDLRTA
jgi:hypothetical protein